MGNRALRLERQPCAQWQPAEGGAGKSSDFTGTPAPRHPGPAAPRFVIVSLEFGARRAVAYCAAETQGSHDCATAVELDRYAAE